uniref:BPTI/Kunitz inhibitor domain-containing protein n=1 Tax=Amblyomma parvum TaxID=251391 RepID=A0A023G0E3_AMBPA
MTFYSTALLLVSVAAVFGATDDATPKPQCKSKDTTKTKYWMPSQGKWYRRDYYYDNVSNQCAFLGFLGCDGNGNNFPSQFDCTDHCRETRTEVSGDYKSWLDRIPANCSMTFIPGVHNGTVLRFYYNGTSKQCQPVSVMNGDAFFPSMRNCVDKCNADTKYLSRCYEAKSSGVQPENLNCTVDNAQRYTICS